MRKRPVDWNPPGPVPPGVRSGDPLLRTREGETLDCLAGHWKIFQLRRGHRYSTDDLLTAWYAAHGALQEAAEPTSLLDLGCGVGSVGLLLLWRFADLRMIGLEAQRSSVELARRSARYNGVTERCTILHADLRQPGAPLHGRRFELVTASPPYLRPGEGRRSDRPQRGPCRFTERGDVREYLRTAAAYLRPRGTVVWVHATRYTRENLDAATGSGLPCVTWRPVIFRTGKTSLITLFRARPGPAGAGGPEEPLTVRGTDGSWTDDYRSVRREMGFPL